MRDYAIVLTRFWKGQTAKFLRAGGSDCLLLAQYLMTCPHSTMTGIYYLPIPILCHETAMTSEGASKALQRAIEADFAFYDFETEMVWVPEMAKIQVADQLKPGDKRIKGIIATLSTLGSCRFIKDFYEKYREIFSLPEEGPWKGLTRGFEGPPKPGSRKQEQELTTPSPSEKGQQADPQLKIFKIQKGEKQKTGIHARLEIFLEEFKNQFDRQYLVGDYSAEGGAAKRTLEKIPDDTLYRQAVRAYLANQEKRYVDSGYPFRWFISDLQRWVTVAKAKLMGGNLNGHNTANYSAVYE